MNKVDKVITAILVRNGEPNPYLDKSNWGFFDYLVGYGAPLAMLFFLGKIIYITMIKS